MATARKFFAGRISIPADSATSLYDCMKASALHWGYESTALTTPALDSINGDEVILVPDGAIKAGDSSVKTSGIPIAAGATYPLQDFAKYGLLDPNAIYLYSQSGSGASLTFHGR